MAEEIHWTLELSQQYWEFTSYAKIKANNVVQVDENTINADGVEIEFAEPVNLLKKN